MVKTRIAVLISGNGTNLQALINAQADGVIKHGRIVLVVSSNSIAHGLKRAEAAGIETAVVTKKQCGSEEAFEQKLIEVLKEHNIELIVLAGFMKILSKNFTREYAGRIINVHPSLIPAFCGKGCYGLHVHEKALEYGVKVTGATVHYVNEVPDGGKIIMQKPVRVKKGDTPSVLQKRVMAEAEWQILPKATEQVAWKLMKEKAATMEQYEINDIGKLINDNSYVGRGIVIGRTKGAGKAAIAYFIMGRSENSRNRVFTMKDGEVFTEPFDESKVEDPSLIIYAAIRQFENKLIVTNGDQTDTIYDHLEAGKSFEDALATRTFEPDMPNFTPRISGMVELGEEEFTYKMSILKSMCKTGGKTGRYYFNYESEPGLGHFIHTYECDGNPLPTFRGEPERVEIPDDIDDFTNNLWKYLDEDNKISLYVRYIDVKTGKYEERIINKREG
ncbi:MAG: phosphoribosylglycinamide formyltransferase [Clostridiales bacterium]|nr:phosphoribosylglycinamide formyltransferase [Clostridiales bacterium]